LDGQGSEALVLFQQALAGSVKDEGAWIRLAMALYDGRHYLEALTAFGVSEKSEEPVLHFMGLVWQGHILDLLGKRPEAVEKYKAALKIPGTPRMKHDQYGMTIDKQWVEERLRAAFTRQ
jgi:tetratricopeptide (TPR) repeat protein